MKDVIGTLPLQEAGRWEWEYPPPSIGTCCVRTVGSVGSCHSSNLGTSQVHAVRNPSGIPSGPAPPGVLPYTSFGAGIDGTGQIRG